MTWPTKKLGEVCEKLHLEKALVDYVPYIEIGDINVETKEINFKEKGAVKGSIYVPANCVIVSRVRPTRGAVALLDKKLAISPAFTILKPKQILDLKFLFYSLAYSPKFFNYLELKQKGSNYPSCREKDILNFEIPLPPLKIQKRIVARIEELFEKIDKAKELRQKIKGQTADIFSSALEGNFSQAKKKKWQIKTVGEVTTRIQYGLSVPIPKSVNKNKALPILRMANVTTGGQMDYSDLRYIEADEKDRQKFLLKKGDILFNWRNSKEYVGKTAVFDRKDKMIFASFLLRLEVRPELVFPEFLSTAINWLWRNDFFVRVCDQAVSQANFNASKLKEVEIFLPLLSEQKKIVAYLDNLHEKVEKLKQLQQKQLEELTELKQSILDKAFKGELVK